VLTRIGVGGVGITYGTITDKAESTASPRPGDLFTRIAVGGVGQTLGTVADKTADAHGPRPGDLLTRIGVGGVGIYYEVTAKAESEVEEDQEGGGYTPYGLATPWEVDLGGETGAEHLADITQQLESEFGLSPDEIEEVVEQAATTGISLSDGRIRRLAQAIHARPKEFDRIRDMVTGHEDGEDVIALILILAEL